MRKIDTSEVIDDKPKDMFIADFFREEIMSGRLRKGDKLVPDEKIARKYKLNKRTVASGLSLLVREGLLSRAPRRGTIVIKDYSNDSDANTRQKESSPEDNTKDQNMPSLYGMDHLFFIAETKVLTFACFETLPKQQNMWKCLIEKFNSTSKARRIELEPVPFDNFGRDAKGLRDYMSAKNKNLDIIQCLFFNISPESLVDLPDPLIEYTTGEDTLSANVLPDFKKLLRKIVPVYTTVPVCVWNREIERTAGLKSLKQNIIEGKLIHSLCSAAGEFPDNLEKIGPHLSCLLRHHGLPATPDKVDMEYFQEFFDDIFAGLNMLKPGDSKRMFIADYNYQSYHNFSRRKHFLLQTLSCPPHYPDADYLVFEPGSAIFPSKYNLCMELSSLGISKYCKEPEFAADFLNFIASGESQLFMHSRINGIPYRKSSLNALPEIHPQITRPEIDLLLDKIRFGHYDWQRLFTIDVISYKMTDLFAGIVDGKINLSDMAAETALKIFNENLNLIVNRK